MNHTKTTNKMNLKKLDMKNKVSKLTIEHESTEENQTNHDKVIAIAILLGGYNEFGRKIPLNVYKEIESRFHDCINEVKDLL